MADKVFVSPGVYTSEKDLTFVTRQVGVTTLGLVGETTIGPAFQPIFITNYGEFQSFFGGLNNTLVNGPDGNGAPQYELPYIAKSYLSQANQLFVTRVLGFSGYDAGQAWAITLDAALDVTTSGVTTTTTYTSSLLTYSATTGGTLMSITSSDSLVTRFYNESLINFSVLGSSTTGQTFSFGTVFTKDTIFTGLSVDLKVMTTGISSTNAAYRTGTTTGTTVYYSGMGYTDVEDKVVAILRSRGRVDATTQLPVFQVSASTGMIIDPAVTTAKANPLGTFSLSGFSNTLGLFVYDCSLDKTQKNYLPKVLGRTSQDGNTAVFTEELFGNMFEKYNTENKIYGINLSLVTYDNEFSDYKKEYQPAVTPYFVSELRGNKVLRLFRCWTISDGNAANEQFKISIANIKPDTKEFDVYVRGYYDTDAQPSILEAFSRCTMDTSSANYIGRRIGTLDGTYASKSTYILIEPETTVNTSDAFPAGFIGFPIRDYQINSNSAVVSPTVLYKKTYGQFENARKYYLGLSETVGIDSDFFDFKGAPIGQDYDQWTGLTNGFHMDINASAATIDGINVVINSTGGTYSPIFLFDTGNATFTTESGLVNGSYEKIYTRKFTTVPYGGFDGWDVYRTRRSNLDSFIINGSKGHAGLVSGTFANKTLSNGDLGINSDYYAYLEAIWTFKNPEAVNVNVFATPGVDTFDNSNLVEAAIEMVEQDRADSLYIATIPDTDASGSVLSVGDVTDQMSGAFDSNYTATYWPWIQILDAENNVYIYVPPTRDVVRNIALTDNIAFPWFAVAGVQRGDVDAIKARKKLTLSERDALYENRINPIATFTSDGIKIWGNKTLQVKDTALNRINVRRLLLQARKLISSVSIRLLFEQNDTIVRNQFLSLVNPILENIRTQRGLTDFRVVLSNDPEDIDRNQLTGKIYLKPTRALEFIVVEFNIMNTGASFDNI
jgi:phage tail sheath protein FI